MAANGPIGGSNWCCMDPHGQIGVTRLPVGSYALPPPPNDHSSLPQGSLGLWGPLKQPEGKRTSGVNHEPQRHEYGPLTHTTSLLLVQALAGVWRGHNYKSKIPCQAPASYWNHTCRDVVKEAVHLTHGTHRIVGIEAMSVEAHACRGVVESLHPTSGIECSESPIALWEQSRSEKHRTDSKYQVLC